jgi:hypothetical protein
LNAEGKECVSWTPITRLSNKQQVMNQNPIAENQNSAPLWKPFLSSYDTSERSVLTFENKQDAYTALDLVWKGHLRGVPFGIPGYNSLVVPKEAVPYFSGQGLKFEESKLLTHDELTAEELNELRKQSIY